MNHEHESWTFGIVTDGHHRSRVDRIIETIRDEKIPEYEIIVVGDANDDREPSADTRYLAFGGGDEWPDYGAYHERRSFPISVKKNLVTRQAKFENICYLHDYVALRPGWYEGHLRLSRETDWHIAVDRVFNVDGSRFMDWIALDHPAAKGRGSRKFGFLPLEASVPAYQFVSGAAWCAKRHVMQEFPLNENLRWGQGEDVEWSRRVRRRYAFTLNPHAAFEFLKEKVAGPHPKSSDCESFLRNSRILEELHRRGELNALRWRLLWYVQEAERQSRVFAVRYLKLGRARRYLRQRRGAQG